MAAAVVALALAASACDSGQAADDGGIDGPDLVVDTEVTTRIDYVAMGDSFSVADAYLFVIANWAPVVGIDITPLKNLGAFMERMRARPAVQAALKAEGLLK